MYEECLVELKRGDAPGTYAYRVVNHKGESVVPKSECTEDEALVLPLIFEGAQFNFQVLDGNLILNDSVDDLELTENLDYDENAERISIFDGLEAGKAGRDLNITKLEETRGDEASTPVKERHLTYEQTLALRKARLKEINDKVERELTEEYSLGGNPEIDSQIEETGFYFDPHLGCKALVAGHGEQYDHWGMDALLQIPVPTPAQIKRYEDAVAAGVPEDKLPMSPDAIRSLCIRAVPLTSVSAEPPITYGPYSNIPVYTSESRVKISERNLTPHNLTLFHKWRMVLDMLEMLDAMATSMLESDTLKICFSERPGLTMGVTSDEIIIGIDFLLEHSIQECAFVLLHESRHLLFEHPSRRGFREPEMWNLAADMIVNKGLVDDFAVDMNDKAGGRIALRVKGVDHIVSDGRYFPKFPKDAAGVYTDRIDMTQDTVERVYTCLEMGVDSYDAALALKKQQKAQNAQTPMSTKSQYLGNVHRSIRDVIDKKLDEPTPPTEDGAMPPMKMPDLTEEQKQAMLAGLQNNPDMGLGNASGGSGSVENAPTYSEEWDYSAYLYKVVLAYAGMLRNGMNCKGEKISPQDDKAVRKILDPYMKLFNLRY